MLKKIAVGISLLTIISAININANAISLDDRDTPQVDYNPNESIYHLFNLTVGGYFIANGGYKNDNFGGELDNVLDSKVYFDLSSADKKSGVYVQIDSGLNDNFLERNPDILEEVYAYYQSTIGRFELGRIKNISEKMQLSAPDVGNLGINNSNAYQYVRLPAGFAIIDSIGSNFGEEKLGLNYVTKLKNNYTLGLNVSPGTDEFNDNKFYPSTGKDFSYGMSASLKKDIFISNALQLAFVGSIANYEKTNVIGYSSAANRQEYTFGSNINYKNWIIGGGVRVINENKAQYYSYEGRAFNFGAAYNFGPIEGSLSYYNSVADGNIANPRKDKSEMYLTSVNYNLDKRSSVSASVGTISYKDENVAQNNNGYFIGFGYKFKFRENLVK